MTLKRLICHYRGHRWTPACVLCEQVRYHDAHDMSERCTCCRARRAAA